MSDTYRVATWNLWGRLGEDPDARQPEMLAILRELDADVVGLQEAWSDDEHDVAGELRAGLGYESSTWVLGAPHSPSGLAVLSRWPIAEVRTWDLPADAESSEGSVNRKLLLARVETPYGVLPFFTTHLTWYAESSDNRCEQVRTILGVVESQPADSLRPVLVGDMNAGPGSPEMQLLRDRLDDVWQWSADPDGGLTWDPRNPYVADDQEPRRIDYVYVGRGSVARDVRQFGDGPGPGGVWATDHIGVVVDLAAPD